MLAVEEPTAREALRAEARPLVANRMRWTLAVSVAGLILSALSDLHVTPPPYQLMALKLAGATAQAATIGLLWLLRASTWNRVAGASVCAWTLAAAVVAINGWYTADPMMPMFCLPLMIVGSALVFPWGVGPQLAVALAASAIMVPLTPQLGTNLDVTIYSAFAVSVYLAATLERQRYERKQIELLQAGQQRVLEQIAADSPLAAIYDAVLETIRQQLPDAACAIVLRSAEGATLHCAAARGLAEELRRTIEGLAVNTQLAHCLAAPVLGNERAVCRDIAADPAWAGARTLIVPHRLRAAWAAPIGTPDRGARGMVAVYQQSPQTPTARELAMMDAAARLIGVALERSDAQQQLKQHLRALDDARLAAERQSVELAEARDHALASMRARSQFLANMSHEIRTPLNGIIGTTEILLDTKLTSSQEEYARILSHCADHLLGVINDILDLSKIEAGKVEIEHVDVDLADLLEEVADVFAVRAHEKNLELATSIAPELATLVRGDPSRLRQVLVNLVGNAIKFTERGEVVLEGHLLSETAADCTVRLAVRDTGVGIPLDRQAAVFDSFTQADGSTTRTYGGTGLGLTISRELVQLMGGHLGVESQPNVGSKFWVDLPFERAPAAAAHPAAPVSLKGLRVLVVDDTATNRLVLRQSLREWGCRVDEAVSGRDALQLLAQGGSECPFDFVILDMQMPELDGLATARHIKAEPRLAAMPLILLSSIGDIDGGGPGASYGEYFAAVVTKPVRRSVLLNAIRGALGRPAPHDEAVRPARTARTLGLRVLLAEDNRVNQLVAQRLLDKLGCHTEIVDNGRAAVEAVARAQYDVVLMDIQMPLIDGFEATAMIRSHETDGARVPIIAMTAHAMEGDSERCIDAGMDGYISKPVRLAALADALSSLLATEQRNTG